MLKVRNEFTGFNQFNIFSDLLPEKVPGITDNVVWLDTFGAHPLDVWDWLAPYMRPPDVPTTLGVGRADRSQPLQVLREPVPQFGVVMEPMPPKPYDPRIPRRKPKRKLENGDTPPGESTWPPVQEVNMAIPRVGRELGKVPVHAMLSPLCYPMHDHSEPTQTAQGGNYNQGLIAGMNFIGDRNADGRLSVSPASNIAVGPNGVLTFPAAPLTFSDPNFGTTPENQRAVFGPDFNKSPSRPPGPIPHRPPCLYHSL